MFKNIYTTYRSFYKDNLTLAVPVMVSQLGQTFVQMADSIVVGHFSHQTELALASVSLANSVFIIILVLGLGISNGLTPLVAQENGAGNHQSCAELLTNSFFINILIGVFLFSTVQFVNYFVLEHMGQDPELVRLTQPFLSYLALSIIPLMIFQTFKQFAEGLGFTKQAMQISIWGNILNIVLGVILVRGMFGLPRMDVVGVGISTLVDRSLMAIAMGLFVWKSKYFKIYIQSVHRKLIHKSLINKILKIGAPVALQYTFEVSAFSGAAIIIGTISPEALAAHQIAISLATATYMLAGGIAAAATIKSGFYFGGNQYVKLRKSAIASYHMVLVFMFLMALLFVFGYRILPYLYTENTEIVTLAANLLLIAGVFQLLDGAQVVGLGVLKGISDVNIPTLITFVAYWLFGLPIGYFLGLHCEMGAQGVWIGLTMGLGIAAIMMFLRFQKLTKEYTQID